MSFSVTFGAGLDGGSRHGRTQSGRKIPSRTESQVPDLSSSGIDFDEVGISGLRLEHEIKSMQARQIQSADHLLDGGQTFRHLSIQRITVAGPAEDRLLITSKCRPAKTVPFQQATVLVASRPFTKVCALTRERRRKQ